MSMVLYFLDYTLYDYCVDVSGARKKIERAKKHVGDLANAVTSFDESEFYSVAVYRDTTYGASYLCIDEAIQRYEFLVTCALVIGDALHNLRSALDILFYQVVGWSGGIDSRRTKFPVTETRQELKAVLRSARINGQITSTVEEFILNQIKPYEAGNPALWALHNLNIIDKHRLLIPTIPAVRITGICLENEENVTFKLPEILTKIPLRTRLNDWLPGSDNMVLRVTDKGHAATEIVFQSALMPLPGKSVVDSLRTVTDEVARSVEAFTSLCI